MRYWLRVEPPIASGVVVAYELHGEGRTLARIERVSRAIGARPSKWRASVEGACVPGLLDGMDAAMLDVGRVLDRETPLP